MVSRLLPPGCQLPVPLLELLRFHPPQLRRAEARAVPLWLPANRTNPFVPVGPERNKRRTTHDTPSVQSAWQWAETTWTQQASEPGACAREGRSTWLVTPVLAIGYGWTLIPLPHSRQVSSSGFYSYCLAPILKISMWLVALEPDGATKDILAVQWPSIYSVLAINSPLHSPKVSQTSRWLR